MALLALAACGDNGGDVTTPSGGLTLTVTGQGTGSGHVSTGSGTSPAIDCTITPGGGTSGACSAAGFAEGAEVPLSITANEGSAFDQWGGDAADCGTELSCVVTMNGNKNVVVQLSAAPVLQIKSSNYFADPEFGGTGGVVWVVEVENPTSQWVDLAEIDFTSHDQSGNVLASDFLFVGLIPPGESRAGKSVAEYFGNESSVDIVVGQTEPGEPDQRLGFARISSSNWHSEPEFGGTGAIVGAVEIENTSQEDLEEVEVNLNTYDAGGKILDVASTFIGPIPAGQKRSGEIIADYRGTEANTKFQVVSVR